ncbi:Calx-beta domain-containing protein [Actinopolymorpha alba]|uniref:Calx-beta domain-containing protein n=1 Tax=Actinopolymorpha alba TaxID=533267 RepID=UPI0003A0C480|nr:Calx-beta domain-containing protein [Actinopolymorpha alba]
MLRRLMVILAALPLVSVSVVVVAAVPARAASIYYVDAVHGNDSTGNGSAGSPWRSISKAAGVAGAGDTVRIRSGTYRETIRPANSGTSGNPITFEPDTGADVTVSGADLLMGSWTALPDSVFRKPVSLPMGDFLDQVYVDGVANNLARSPNTPVGNLYDPKLWERDAATSNGSLLSDPVNLDQPDGTWDGAALFVEDSGSWNFSSALVESSTPGKLKLKRDQKSYRLKLSTYDNALQLIGPAGNVLGAHAMTVAQNTTYNLKVTASGSSIQVFLNNGASPVISVTNSEVAEGSFGLGLESENGSAAAKVEFTNVNATITSQDPNQAPGRHAATFASNIRGWTRGEDTGWWESDGTTLRGYTQPQSSGATAWYDSPTTAKDFTYAADVKLTAPGRAYLIFRKERLPGWVVDLADWGLGGSEYFIMGKLAALDYPGEWYYDKAAGQLYLRTTASDNPANHTVEYKARNLAFDLTQRSYVRIKGVKVFAATIDTTDGSNNVIDGINAKYVSEYNLANGWNTGICLCGTHDTLKNSEIAFSSGSLVTMKKDNNKLVNNLIHDGTYGGIAFNSAIELLGRGHLVSNNTVYHSGRSLIGGEFFAAIIQYNDFHHGNYFAHDTGMLYTAHNDLGNSEIHHNYWHDNVFRSNGEGEWTGGIYLDESSANALIYDNVTWNLSWLGIIVNHLSNFVQVYNNTTYNTSGIRVSEPTYGLDAYGDRIQNNIATQELGTGATSIGAVFGNNLTSGDPEYVSLPAKDFHLTPGSPARNAGTPIRGITEGFEGTAPDIGAYEVGGADWKAGHNFANPPIVAYQPTDTDYQNLVVNGSLDLNRMQHPQLNSLYGWTRTHSKTAQPTFDFSGGEVSSRFHHETGVALGTGEDGIEQTISGLKPNTTYKIRGFLRVSSDGQGVRLGVKGYGGADAYEEHTTTTWSEKTLTFTTGATNTSATIYGYKPTTGGYAWVDDIMMNATVPTPTPALRVSDATVSEGNSDTSQASFTVSLSPASSSAVTVAYATADATAVAPGDYTAANGTLTFAPGETSKVVNIPVVGDTAVEQDESFSVTLSSPTGGAVIADGLGVGTILNDDAAVGTTTVNDHTTGTGTNQFEFVGSWATNANDTAYQDDVTFSMTTNDYYQLRFIGTQFKLYSEKSNLMGIVAVSVDGGPETMVDTYAATQSGNVLVYTSPVLPSAPHTLKVRVTGTKNASSTGTWHVADRVDIINQPTATTSVNDHTTGTGTNEFEFVGSWATNANDTAYQGDVTFSDQTDAYYQVRFNGTQVKVYSEKSGVMGKVAISVDGGAETVVDTYSPTQAGNVLIFTSPALTSGQHILKVRVTGTKNPSASWTWHVADRVEITS